MKIGPRNIAMTALLLVAVPAVFGFIGWVLSVFISGCTAVIGSEVQSCTIGSVNVSDGIAALIMGGYIATYFVGLYVSLPLLVATALLAAWQRRHMPPNHALNTDAPKDGAPVS